MSRISGGYSRVRITTCFQLSAAKKPSIYTRYRPELGLYFWYGWQVVDIITFTLYRFSGDLRETLFRKHSPSLGSSRKCGAEPAVWNSGSSLILQWLHACWSTWNAMQNYTPDCWMSLSLHIWNSESCLYYGDWSPQYLGRVGKQKYIVQADTVML